MRTISIVTGVLALALAGSGPAAFAADSGFYFSGSVGSTNIDDSGFDDSDTSFHPSVGYDFNENWAVEAGYDNFGTPKDSCGTGCDIKVKDAWGYNLRLVGTLPLNTDWSIFGSVGWQHWDIKARLRNQLVASITDSENGDDVVGGVGAKWKLGESFSVKAGFDYFEAKGADISTWYIGGEKKFH